MSILLTGCNPNAHTNTYDVMFAKQPLLIDDGVYLRGNRIGTVVSDDKAAAPIGRLAISIDGPYQELMRTNVVLYIASGRLNLASLGGYGEPLDKETKVLGFKSKASLAWFKARYLLKNQSSAAAKEAEKLYQRTTM
jgi:hypothetical protein